MASDRPITEHEGALFDVVRVLATTLLDLGADPKVLRERLTAAREAADALGNRHSAETIAFLIQALFEPQNPGPRPTLRIV